MNGVGGFDGTRWRIGARAGLAAASLAFAVAATAAAEETATLDRRAQSASRAEFDHFRMLAHSGGHVRVIVGLRVTFTPEGALSPAARETQHRTIASAGAAVRAALSGTDHRVTHAYDSVPLIALELSEGALTRLQSANLAATLWEDTPRPPDAADGLQPKAVARAGAVALLDTGIDKARLRTARIVSEACFSANGNCPNGTAQQTGAGAARACDYAADECRHGTQVAAAKGDIVAIQVFSRFAGEQCPYGERACALSYESDQIAGLQHVLRLHDSVAIGAVRLSLGNGLFGLNCSDNPLKPAIDNLNTVGVRVLIAPGNGGVRDLADTRGCLASADAGDDTAAGADFSPAASALPDLIVSAGELTQSFPNISADFAIRGVETKFTWEHTTKNVMLKGQATKKAGASQTGVKFSIGKISTFMDPLLNVPSLAANKTNSDNGKISDDFAVFDYGTYETRICADVRKKVVERSDTNNCRNTGPFYLLPAHIAGTAGGTYNGPNGFVLHWEGPVDFVFDSRSGGTAFNYIPGSGTSIKFNASGTTGGCTWSGSTTYKPKESDGDHITLTLGSKSTYVFDNIIREGFGMTYTLTCPKIPPIDAPLDLSGTRWVDSGGKKKMPVSGPWHLHGQFVESSFVNYTWNLNAKD